ncbi:hypothetical protein [Methanococcoides alaskense]|uniref:Uncharacterized protein n=1 Tax=Methanococcoides alaskense TaxID=325778 RepID=A0AA90TZ17_9EURY|nr:hypothetical protein [Methanococcoides alaskense]MDA0524101.1 hypothetical protein [Methanococcoides alaskense]MDR6222551.1 hypothetical protein [Methanococcoides alaskense]
MNKRSKYVIFGSALVLVSAVLHLIHYLIFHDMHHISIYLIGRIAFVPIEVLLASLIIHHFLESIENKHKMEKLNMIIGSFFSEIGNDLLTVISDADPELDDVRDKFAIKDLWAENEFKNLGTFLKSYTYKVDMNKIDLAPFASSIISKRGFMVSLLQNPVMFEHESFTELLRAVFHLTEELEFRGDLSDLPKSDRRHLSGDVKRVYGLLSREWLAYMKYQKVNYPYLFSLSMRTNPFDKDASVVVTE